MQTKSSRSNKTNFSRQGLCDAKYVIYLEQMQFHGQGLCSETTSRILRQKQFLSQGLCNVNYVSSITFCMKKLKNRKQSSLSL